MADSGRSKVDPLRSIRTAEGAAGEAFEHEGEGEDCEGERKTGGGGVDAEDFQAGGDSPVEERRFFEVADAVGVQGDPT